jgi:phage shock protein E
MQPAAANPAGAAQARSAARGDTLWVDVRTPEEFTAGHVANAVNIPFDAMEQRWTELERYRGQPVVLYCHSGRRAGIALQVLQAHGFTKATNGGGLEALRQAGEPVTP